MPKSLIIYVLTAAFRDRLFWSFLVLLGVGISLSFFLGSSALIEAEQFSVVFASGGLRIASVMALVLFVVFFIRRSFDSRDVEYILTRPISRLQFLLSHALAFQLMALVVALVVSACVIILAPGKEVTPGYFLWGFSLFAELFIMVNVALFFSMVLSSAVGSALISMGFYVLARLIGQILGIIERGEESGIHFIMEQLMYYISVLIPRLDLMGQTAWLLYPLDNIIGYGFIVAQTVIFSAIILCAALIDLTKKQF